MTNPRHEKLNYVEYPSPDLEATKSFFNQVFGWSFQDFGPNYTSFANEGLDGGFYKAGLRSRADDGSALLVFYSADLESTQSKVRDGGGEIFKEIYEFPGGRRFHFLEPGGNEFAVWSDKST